MTGRISEVEKCGLACVRTARDRDLDDLQKQMVIQGHARRLFWLMIAILGLSLVSVAVPVAVIWLLDQGGLVSFRGTFDVLRRIDFLAVVSIVGILVALLRRTSRA
jgi:hypothetical protein